MVRGAGGIHGKRSCLQCKRLGFDPWVRKILRRKWLPTPVFQPGEFHGQRSLASCSPRGHNWETNTLTFQWSEGLNGAGGLRTHISEASPGLFTGGLSSSTRGCFISLLSVLTWPLASPRVGDSRQRATEKPELLYGPASEITLQNFHHIHLPGESGKPDPPWKGGKSGTMIWREQWQRICGHILASAQAPSFTIHVFIVHTLYRKYHINAGFATND